MRRSDKAKAKTPTNRQRKQTLSDFNEWLRTGKPAPGRQYRKVPDVTNT